MIAEGHATPEDVADLVAGAAAGDAAAWERLVDEYAGLLWAVTRSFRLRECEAADVVQTTWLRLLEHIDRLNDPPRVGAWLATTARRECLRMLAHSKRTVLAGADDRCMFERPDESLPDLDARLLTEENAVVVHEALEHLPPRWRDLVELLMDESMPSYEQIAARLNIPIGSIGPTRGRALRRLRSLIDDEDLASVAV